VPSHIVRIHVRKLFLNELEHGAAAAPFAAWTQSVSGNVTRESAAVAK
jgi:hypothetical protein